MITENPIDSLFLENAIALAERRRCCKYTTKTMHNDI